jgi:hypothetical protein
MARIECGKSAVIRVVPGWCDSICVGSVFECIFERMSECPVDQPTDEVLRPLPLPAGHSPLILSHPTDT